MNTPEFELRPPCPDGETGAGLLVDSMRDQLRDFVRALDRPERRVELFMHIDRASYKRGCYVSFGVHVGWRAVWRFEHLEGTPDAMVERALSMQATQWQRARFAFPESVPRILDNLRETVDAVTMSAAISGDALMFSADGVPFAFEEPIPPITMDLVATVNSFAGCVNAEPWGRFPARTVLIEELSVESRVEHGDVVLCARMRAFPRALSVYPERDFDALPVPPPNGLPGAP